MIIAVMDLSYLLPTCQEHLLSLLSTSFQSYNIEIYFAKTTKAKHYEIICS